MTKILIITGLTASGKSNLAIDIAKRYNGEIISADSVQIYRGLDIGSAKESKETMNDIPHHLIDIRDFNETYNVGEFLYDCENAIQNILSRGRLPIIVGGTGLYVKALLEGYQLGNLKSNIEFRTKYEILAKDKGNKYVWDELYKINPERANQVHYNNIKRVIRYLEIEHLGGNIENSPSILKDYDVLALGIIADREIIYDKINNRVDKMIDLGLESEVRALVKIGATREHQSMNTIGYKEWFDYFEDRVDRDTTIALIKQHTRNYCKRQLTFLKSIKDIKLVKKDEAKILIEEFLND